MEEHAAARLAEPPPEGQGPLELSLRRKAALALGPTLFVVTVLLPTPQGAADAALAVGQPPIMPQVALGTLLWVLVWWVTEALPLGLATLIVPLVFGLAGVLPWRTSLASYADPIIWIFMAGFVLAAAFQKWGLSQRVSIALALAYKGNNPKIAALFVACLPVFLLTVTGSITASTTIVLPFVSAYLAALGLKAGVQLNDAQAARLRDVAAAEAAHRVATRLLAVHPRTEHELGRKLRWDPANEVFVGEGAREANEFLARPMRKPYDYTFAS